MDFNWQDYNNNGWGKVFLSGYHSGLNQRFKYLHGNEFAVKGASFDDLCLGIYNGQDNNGAEAGFSKNVGNDHQIFEIIYQGIYFALNLTK